MSILGRLRSAARAAVDAVREEIADDRAGLVPVEDAPPAGAGPASLTARGEALRAEAEVPEPSAPPAPPPPPLEGSLADRVARARSRRGLRP